MSSASPSATRFCFVIEEEDIEASQRLDVFLTEQDEPPLTRSQIKRCLDAGEVLVNDAPATKAGYKLRAGDQITWDHAPPQPPDLIAQNLPLTFLHHDEHLAIVDKPAGMVVHPSFGHPNGTLVNALLYHLQALSSLNTPTRPGIVHRIDKDTSGALAITCTDEAHRHLAEKFRTHSIERTYHALVLDHGLPDHGTFDTLHGRDPRNRFRFTGNVERGKRAVTHYTVLERFDQGIALVECRLETGRTHQIRMHFFDAQCPLLGDQLYGGPATQNNRLIDRQALHAYTLGFTHLDGEELLTRAPYPEDFANALEALREGKKWRKKG